MATTTGVVDEPYLGLHCLYNGTGSDTTTLEHAKNQIHIIGVHGLGADPRYTWESKKPSEEPNASRVNWLRDLLPQDLESLNVDCNYCIYCYNYSSEWLGQDSPKQHLPNIARTMLKHFQRLADQSPSLDLCAQATKTPVETSRSAIILVGHSFGGLVIEQAIVIANMRGSPHSGLLRAIGGIIFLGTPHRGSDSQQLGIMLARAAEAFNYGSSELMNQLATDSSSLSELVDSFIRVVRHLEITLFCFFELLPTDFSGIPSRRWISRQLLGIIPKILIVTESSATLQGYDKIGLDTDHSGLNKYPSCDDSNYRLICSTLGEMTKSCTERMRSQNDRCDKILEWLCSSDPWNIQDSRKTLHQKGTGAWVLEEEALLKWLSGKSRMAWIRGIAGAGKTVLMSFIVDETKKIFWDTSTPNVGFVFHYFQFQDPLSLTPRHFFGSLVRQMCQQFYLRYNYVPPEVDDLFSRRDRNGKIVELTIRDLLAILDCLEARFSYCLVAIDALDECPQSFRESDILPFLQQKMKCEKSRTNFLVSSRGEGDIAELLDQSPKILLHEDNVGPDIRLYIDAELRRFTSLRNMKEPHKSETVNQIVKSAKNMFLYAKYQLDVCRRLRTVNDIRNAARARPDVVDQLYDAIIEQIGERGGKDLLYTRRILLWLTFAGRALTVAEVIDAIAVEDDNRDRDENGLISPNDILSICGSLVELKVSRSGSKILQLSHHTIAEYVKITGREASPNPCRLTATEANAEIARVCSRYLTFDVFRGGPCYPYNPDDIPSGISLSGQPIRALTAIAERIEAGLRPQWHEASEEKLMNRLRQYPLLYYSAHYLLPKSSYGGRSFKSPFIDSLLHITGLAPGRFEAPLFYSFLEVLSIDAHSLFWNKRHLQGELIGYASQFGTVTPLRELETIGLPKSKVSRLYHHALMVAVEESQIDMIDFILESEYCNEAKQTWIQDSLMTAIGITDLQMVDYLLAKGASLNVQAESSECTPLSLACALGDVNTLLDFLQRGVEVNAFEGLALAKACQKGHHLVAEILLEHGAEPNICNLQGEYPLKFAITRGDEAMVQVLLDHGANVNYEFLHDLDCTTPLQTACFHGHTTIVERLIHKGADLDRKTVCRFPTPLMAAVANNHLEIIKFLISTGVHVDSNVSAESREFHETIVDGDPGSRYVMVKPWMPHQEESRAWYTTALEMACHMGHDEAVRMLLEAGADPNAQCVMFGDILRAACACGDTMQTFRPAGQYIARCRTKILSMLLSRGARTRSHRVGKYGTVWHALLASNANFELLRNETDDEEWNKVVRLLISRLNTGLWISYA